MSVPFRKLAWVNSGDSGPEQQGHAFQDRRRFEWFAWRSGYSQWEPHPGPNVIPAQAGIQWSRCFGGRWIPAFAGMTMLGVTALYNAQ